MIKIYSRLKLFLSWLYIQHQKMIFTDFDPIKDWSFYFSKAKNRFDKYVFEQTKGQFCSYICYLMPCLVFAFIIPDSLYISVVETNSTMPSLYTHLIIPESFWPQTDIIFEVAIVMASSIYGNLLFNRKYEKMINIYFIKSEKNDQLNVMTNNNCFKLTNFVLAKTLIDFRLKIKKLLK